MSLLQPPFIFIAEVSTVGGEYTLHMIMCDSIAEIAKAEMVWSIHIYCVRFYFNELKNVLAYDQFVCLLVCLRARQLV